VLPSVAADKLIHLQGGPKKHGHRLMTIILSNHLYQRFLGTFAVKLILRIQLNQIKKGLLLSQRVKKILKSVNIWQSYKQERDCLMHFLRLLPVCCPGALSV